MKNGIFAEDGQQIYYKNDKPCHAGVIKIGDDIYYIGRHGKVATGQHIVHGEMSNGILKRGTYTFSEEGKLIEGTYIPPKTKRRKHSKKKNKRSIWRKVNKKTFVLCLSLLLIFAVLLTTAIILDNTLNKNSEKTESAGESVVFSDIGSLVTLSSPAAAKLYKDEITIEQALGYEPYKPFEFAYSISEDGVFSLSESADMADAKDYILSKNNKTLSIDNLMTGKTYYYTAKAGEKSVSGSFFTEEGTRYVYIPGVENTRDIGGYETSDGSSLRQGMIIRGTELDAQVDNFFLSPNDSKAVMEQFGFVYEMDLRDSASVKGDKTSRLSEQVRHEFFNAPAFLGVFEDNYRESLRSIFTALSKSENYPMYMHCTYGADRTGTIVFLIQGILGMEEEDMLREYSLTAFFNKDYANTNRVEALIEALEKYEGETLSEKITDFLMKDVGVTEKEIEDIRNILLEK